MDCLRPKKTTNTREPSETMPLCRRSLCFLLARLASAGLVWLLIVVTPSAAQPAPAAERVPRRLPPPIDESLAAEIERLPPPRPVRLPPLSPTPPPMALLAETLPPIIHESPIEPREPVAEQPITAAASFAFCEFCGDNCGTGDCCGDCADATRWGRFGSAVYRGLCCPDPCYDPVWRPLADTAFFTAAVRPQNQQRFRWDFAEDMTQPDRAEYFWARIGGKGPSAFPNGGIDYDELRHYTEIANGAFGASFEYSYRSLDGLNGTESHAAGFGDLTIGAKTLLFDTELVQVAFQLQTHVPQGNPAKGLGVGHTSLEPGLILGLNLSQDSYVQAEVSEWIPLGGDDSHAGALLRYNVAYNRVLARPHPCVPLIGTIELAGWRFQDGAYTAPASATFGASGASFLQTSAGMRLFFCERADFGVSYATGTLSDGWADTLIRTELRFRY